MRGEPSFVFARDGETARGIGPRGRVRSLGGAARALTAGQSVAGALGFDPAQLCALTVFDRLERSPGPIGSVAPPARTPIAVDVTPADLHRERVRAALRAIESGEVGKAVLARTLRARFRDRIDPAALTGAFAHGNPASTVFEVTLDEAGRRLIGASPELLLRKRGALVHSHPFAGSAPRSGDPAADRAAAAALLASAKNLAEHAYVVDDLRRVLTPLCARLDVPAQPVLIATSEMWHLATPIHGQLADPAVTALELAALLSPTPAVCGTPTAAAADLITRLEGPREFYAGAVGWCDSDGDGDWVVSIRCLELSADGRAATTWAGGGIVGDSDPDDEVAETDAKFRTATRALGLGGG